ncbi:proline-rich transmembrane protein 4 isoform X3 [Hemicordylus capensis]|uniref:proline-rich transmembrane protein 4 isoform X3 n=1 Tax=Hemicordylus capensis TaxID=884348 RepID=UPI00230396DA|nr:proline-rich transmembrane protein 4 isoform X3 [Hemicordylus capensis]
MPPAVPGSNPGTPDRPRWGPWSQDLVQNKQLKRSEEAMAYQARKERVPDELWAALLEDQLNEAECVKTGWVLDGFPETREQGLLLQTRGIAPRHVVVLFAPDTVLVERNLGKLLDPITQEVYHTTFDWPVDFAVQKRLVVPEGISEQATTRRLLESHRNLPGILRTYPGTHKAINADQPCADVFAQALSFVQSRPRSNAPFTPRVVLLGPPASGKRLQAALLAQKYELVSVCFGELLREKVADQTAVGELVRPFLEQDFPVRDSIALQVLKQRLTQKDCLALGWVLHGFPRDVDQADLMKRSGLEPSRVFFLHLPLEVAMQRVCQRTTDPVSGERYHSIFKPPTEEEVHRRLRRNPRDAPQRLELKTDFYNRQAGELEEYYEDAFFINADQDPYTIFEYIESCLLQPLPVRKA